MTYDVFVQHLSPPPTNMEEDTPEIAPIRYQINRERRCERDALSDQLTNLKSLLRLDADGIGDREDLLDVLDKARQTIERYSITLRRESLSLDSPAAHIAPPNPHGFVFDLTAGGDDDDDDDNDDDGDDGGDGDGGDDSDGGDGGDDGDDGGDGGDGDDGDDGDNGGGGGGVATGIRLRSLSGASSTPSSSWRSSSSTASTAATSISPRDSFFSRRFAPPPIHVSPTPSYLRRLRGEEFRFGDEMGAFIEEEENCEEADEDASFQRLSSILASLQQQAEAAVLSPATAVVAVGGGEEDEGRVAEGDGATLLGPASFWRGGGGARGGDISPSSTRTITCGGAPRSAPSTPGLATPTLASPRRSAILLPRPPSARLGMPDRLLPQFSPASPPSSCPSTPNLTRRRTAAARPTSEGDGGGGGGGTTKWEDLEGLLAEFLEERGLFVEHHQQDMAFRWVWVYVLSGGLVWTAVGWLLGWGCGPCDEAAACVRS